MEESIRHVKTKLDLPKSWSNNLNKKQTQIRNNEENVWANNRAREKCLPRIGVEGVGVWRRGRETTCVVMANKNRGKERIISHVWRRYLGLAEWLVFSIYLYSGVLCVPGIAGVRNWFCCFKWIRILFCCFEVQRWWTYFLVISMFSIPRETRWQKSSLLG